MPTAVGHSFFGYGLYKLSGSSAQKLPLSKKVLLLITLVLPAIPDLDVVTFRWVPYQHILGHRGFFHSIGFFIPASLLLAGILHLRLPKPRHLRPSLLCAIYFFLLLFSHGVLDTFTDGGKGVMLFYPITQKRYFAPFRPIPVSSIPGFELYCAASDRRDCGTGKDSRKKWP